MGAFSFFNRVTGANADSAFQNAVEAACDEHGRGGYTGTIAEKCEFVNIPLPDCTDPQTYAEQLINDCDVRIEDKWGPAGCIQTGPREFLFFGLAST